MRAALQGGHWVFCIFFVFLQLIFCYYTFFCMARISRFPQELLLKIFELVYDYECYHSSDTKSMYPIASVCRLWRKPALDIILGVARFEASDSIVVYNPESISSLKLQSNVSMIALHRAAHRVKRISINICTFCFLEHYIDAIIRQLQKTPALAPISSVRHVVFQLSETEIYSMSDLNESHSNPDIDYRNIAQRFALQVPCATRLDFVPSENAIEEFGQHLVEIHPGIQSVLCTSVSYFQESVGGFHNLVRLCASTENQPLQSIIQHHMPSLQHLELWCLSRSLSWGAAFKSSSDQMTPFPQLVTLALSFKFNHHFLNYPAFTTVYQNEIAVNTKLKVHFPRLQNLRLEHYPTLNKELDSAAFPNSFKNIEMIGTLLQARNCYDFRPGSAKHLTVDLRTIEDTEQDEFFEWTSSVFGSSCQYKSTLLRIRSCKLLPDMSQAHWYMLTQLDMDMTVPDRFLLNVVYRLIGLQILAVKSVLLDEGYMCLTVVSAMTKARQLKAIQLGSHLFKLTIGDLCGKFSTSILEKDGILFDLISAIVSLRRVRLPGTCRRSVEELVASSSASIPHIAKIDFAF